MTEANYSTGAYYPYYHYTYDSIGNRLTQETLLGTNTYTYDLANRLTDVNGVSYNWDNNGNLLNDGVNAYTYDSANRLKTFNGQDSNATYGYNGLGDRLQETVNGQTTIFTMDLNTGLTQALSDGTNNYIYGLGRIVQTHDTTTEYFLGDALGSVRQLTSAGGAITYTRAYDPYGVVTSTSGFSQSAFGYTSEYSGDSTDLLYLRARYYAPGMGRFLTRDTFAGNPTYPSSLNHYSYGGNNPILYTDPSGNCIFAGIDTAACIGALAGGGINLYMQLHRNGGNWSCVDWGDVAVSAGAGAVAGAVAFVAFPVFLPTAGATFADFVLAGGLSGIVAGQAGRSTSLILSGNGNQVISSFAQPKDVLNDFVFGASGGGAAYGVQSVINSISSVLRISVGVPDAFSPPSATGQWRNWSRAEQLMFTNDVALSENQVRELSQIAINNNCEFAICGSMAETPIGLRNRFYGIQSGPRSPVGPFEGRYEYRNTGLPTLSKDLDYWTPNGADIPDEVVSTIFGPNTNLDSIDLDNYFHYWGSEVPAGSLVFRPDGTIIQNLGPWQFPFDWNGLYH